MSDGGWADFPPRVIAVVNQAIAAGLIPGSVAPEANVGSEEGWAKFPERVLQVVNGAINGGQIILPPLVVPLSFVGGASSPTSNTLSIAGLKPGDLIIAASMGLSQNALQPGWGYQQLAKQTGSPSLFYSFRRVAPGDGTSFAVTAQSSASYAACAFRGVTAIDGSVAGASGLSVSPNPGGWVSVDAGDISVVIYGWDVPSGSVLWSGPDAGFTVGAAVNPGVFGSGFGVAIEYALNQPAGAQPPFASTGTLNTSVHWAAFGLSLTNATS